MGHAPLATQVAIAHLVFKGAWQILGSIVLPLIEEEIINKPHRMPASEALTGIAPEVFP
jgi:hypothetical protein